MIAIFALGSSISNSLAIFFTRVGLRHYSLFSAFVISLVPLLLFSITLALFTVPLDQFARPEVIYFIAAGFMGPFIARFLLYIGLDRVGASITSPIHATKSLFATLAAIVVLGENLTLSIALGILLIVIGAVSISSEESGGTIEKEWSKKDLLFPIMSSVCLGIANLFRKLGLNALPSPVMGLAVQNITALVFLPVLILAQQNTPKAISTEKRAWFIFCLAGLCLVISQLCMYYALNLGQVILAIPLSSLNPLFVLILVGGFLKKTERITLKIVLGTIFIMGGAIVLTVKSLG